MMRWEREIDLVSSRPAPDNAAVRKFVNASRKDRQTARQQAFNDDLAEIMTAEALEILNDLMRIAPGRTTRLKRDLVWAVRKQRKRGLL